MTTTDTTAPITEYIVKALPWVHGHQVKGIADYVEEVAQPLNDPRRYCWRIRFSFSCAAIAL